MSNLPVGAYERGPQPLGDELFLLSMDDSGRPLLSPRVRGLGLAAALLAELMIAGVDWSAPRPVMRHVTIVRGRVRLTELDPPDWRHVGKIGIEVYRDLMSEAELQPVGTWLAYLGHNAEERVAERLAHAGRLHVTRRRLRRTPAYEPADITASYPQARLATALQQQKRVGWPDSILLGLAWATGLGDRLLAGAPARARTYLDHLLSQLPGPLHELVTHTRAAAGDATLSART